MKVVYQSLDRCIFHNAEACLAHEAAGLLFEMYDMNGEAVEDTSDAELIRLREDGGEAFLKACQEDDAGHKGNGIERYSEGWFYWDDEYYEFQSVNMELYRAMAKVNPSFEAE